MRWVGHVALMGDVRNSKQNCNLNPEKKRPLIKPWHRWEDNIKMELKETGCGLNSSHSR
jgi:hypothetical protein